MTAWWDDDDDVEVRPPTVVRTVGDAEALWDDRYPHIARRLPEYAVGEAPAEYGRWRARRWTTRERKRLRDADRDARNARVAGWRKDRPEAARYGLGVVLVVVALAFAALVWWRASSHHTPPPVPSAPAAVDAAPVAPTSAAPSPTLPAQRSPGSDAPAAAGAPAELVGKAGDVAYRFLLAYDTYSPANPAAVDTWVGSWKELATGSLAASAKAEAPVLWQSAATGRVSIIAQAVTGCRRVADAPADTTWECAVTRARFPIGGAASASYSTETAHLRVEVTGADRPLVATVAVLGVDAPRAASPTR